MKFTLVSALVAGAALIQVGASPLRVVIVTSSQDVGPKLRLGHAAAHANNYNGPAAMLARPSVPEGKMRGPCRGARFRQKAVDLSNTFRKALGFPMIETDVSRLHRVPSSDGMVHILPYSTPSNAPGTTWATLASMPAPVQPHRSATVFVPHPHPHRIHHQGQTKHRMERPPFMKRLHFALMALGPWEGRAVAFVLGCGIGVLLRMLWVLSIISYRLMRGPREDENRYTEIIVIEDDAEEIFVAPPTYTYADDKVETPAPIVQSTEEAK